MTGIMVVARARRGRPPLISRDRILDVARRIPARKLTMPAVARVLGVSTPALYRHFESRDELLSALGARLSDKFKVRPADPAAWREWLLDTVVSFYGFLVDNPVILQTSGWSHFGEAGQVLLQTAHETLQGAGFDNVEATEIWGLVAGHAYLRARLLHDAPAHGDPKILRAASRNTEQQSEANANRWLAFVDARGTSDPHELLVQSLRWLVSSLPEPLSRRGSPVPRG